VRAAAVACSWVRDLVGRKPDRVESRGGVVGRLVAADPVAACFILGGQLDDVRPREPFLPGRFCDPAA
jgi:hypothetical protein